MEEIESNIVYVGNKESSVYVLYALHQFMINGDKEIVLQARGNSIPKAIVFAEKMTNSLSCLRYLLIIKESRH